MHAKNSETRLNPVNFSSFGGNYKIIYPLYFKPPRENRKKKKYMSFLFFFFFFFLNIFQYSQNEYVLNAQQHPNHFPIVQNTSTFKVWWLHIPKTGTSIINTITRFCCSRLPDGIKVPHDSDAKGWLARQRKMMSRYHLKPLEDKCKIVAQVHEPFVNHSSHDFWITFVRDPKIRLRSAYQYKMLTPGLNASMKKELQNTVHNLVDFSLFPGVKGCQTKMFTGSHCSDHTVNVSFATVLEARKIISRHFAFIGITDRWLESICLFHAMYGGKVKSVEIENVRPSPTTRVYSPLEFDLISDPFDQMVYQFGLNWFEEQLFIHQESVQKCVHQSSPSSDEAKKKDSKLA